MSGFGFMPADQYTVGILEVGDVVVVEKPNGDPYYGRVEQRTEESVRTEQVALAEVVPFAGARPAGWAGSAAAAAAAGA